MIDVVVELMVIEIREAVLVDLLLCLAGLPVSAHVIDAILVILLRVIVAALAAHALPHRQMLGVDGDAVVVLLAARANVCPSALLLLEVETRGVREEECGEEHTGETEPGDDVKLGLDVDVVVEDGGEEGAELADGSGEPVSCGADGRGEDLSRDEEGDGVGAELVEEGREEVHGLEGVDALDVGVVVVVEGWDDEEDEVHEEANLLHPLASVVLVVDEEG